MLFLGWWDQTSYNAVTSRLFDPWPDESVVLKRLSSADQSHVPLPVPLRPLAIYPEMASDKAHAVISIHTPSSSLALVHTGLIVYLSHTSSSHAFASCDRIPDVTLRQA